ncbi:MAG: ROK family protein [Anaerolineae bacterium]|nr:ROK family protein [Anaerolineae bacterium]MBT7192280.1 ROK family protein [Anaerolineae bacterium]MBT7991898.1 ROK family protein [Anaerolineae bacterium]
MNSIQFTPGGISRAGLARQLGLTRSAITTIVSDLMETGAIQESAKKTGTSGRPRTLLEITPEAGYVAGIDMGATHLRVVVSNFGAQVIREKEIAFDIAQDPEICLEKTDRLLQELLEEANLTLPQLSSIGVGVPGPVSADAGMVIAPPIMPGWDRFPIRKTLEKLWGLPISVNNDAELGALGEWAYGAGRNAKDLAYIKVGHGIGAGLLINGQIYRGSTGSAGEIGHLTIDEKGPICTCGNRGCLEALSGGGAIALQAKNAVKEKKNTQLREISTKNISAKDVAFAAQRGDFLAQQIMEEAGEHLGVALAGLINIFNPDMIIVGGGVAQMGDILLEPIRKTVKERSLLSATTNVRITTALLGRRSSSMGAVAQALSIAIHMIAEK